MAGGAEAPGAVDGSPEGAVGVAVKAADGRAFAGTAAAGRLGGGDALAWRMGPATMASLPVMARVAGESVPVALSEGKPGSAGAAGEGSSMVAIVLAGPEAGSWPPGASFCRVWLAGNCAGVVPAKVWLVRLAAPAGFA